MYIHAGISGAEITFQGKDAQAFLSKLCMNNISKWKNGKNKHLVMLDEEGFYHGRYHDSGCFQ